ncbi:hypothetical protein ACFOSC_13770 [Streptantibioticus rubrisoli]|uniref:Uncharacterized protein n=1 Tax=Streptantibioticus rubrisoli TaxID=1387313 RepID=A0ABT1PCA5_9ACTN|nr:hypothetical protein [Streptantibioticus rubrisoli]MCQ4043009.1 hypothetical protein [Streptantibioticus rubrisoli]
MTVPLWFVVLVVSWLAVRLVRPPWWVVALLLLGGFLLAHSFLAPAIESGTHTGVGIVNGTTK